MNRQRRDQVWRQTLRHLASMLDDYVGVDGGLYQNPNREQMTDEECELAKNVANLN